jgi:D-ribose pyranase
MKETGVINRGVASAIAKQGHGDLLMVTDAGFAIPPEVEVIDLSLDINKPMVLDVLEMLKKNFSVEKIVIANQTRETSPTLFKNISKAFGDGIKVETVDHSNLKEMSKSVKTVIRTGDFTAYGNVILVSGAGERWFCENAD